MFRFKPGKPVQALEGENSLQKGGGDEKVWGREIKRKDSLVDAMTKRNGGTTKKGWKLKENLRGGSSKRLS